MTKLLALALLLATAVPARAQTAVTGTWRVDGETWPLPWEVVLRADGAELSGVVKTCFSNGAREIFDGVVNGSIVTFRCRSGDGSRTISFRGDVRDGKIDFSWTLELKDGATRDPRPDAMFGSSAPSRFTARKVPDGELAKALHVPRGNEYAAAVNLPKLDISARGELFVPTTVKRARLVLVVDTWALGSAFYYFPQTRGLATALGGVVLGVQFSGIAQPPPATSSGSNNDTARYEVFTSLLRRMADETGHVELLDAPLLFWGHSAAATHAMTFAGQFPERTVAFVRYHVGGAGATNLDLVSKIPALILTGGKEFNRNNLPESEALWKRGRSLGAPWTFGVEPEASHGDVSDLMKAMTLMVPWVTAVVAQRMPPTGLSLLSITETSAWLGNNQTGDSAPYGAFVGSKTDASWLPDEATVQAWRDVTRLR